MIPGISYHSKREHLVPALYTENLPVTSRSEMLIKIYRVAKSRSQARTCTLRYVYIHKLWGIAGTRLRLTAFAMAYPPIKVSSPELNIFAPAYLLFSLYIYLLSTGETALFRPCPAVTVLASIFSLETGSNRNS